MVGLVATERFIEWLIFSQFALPFSKTILKFPETVKRFVFAFLHQPSLSRHDAARNVGGVVGVAMNSVLLVHEHPEEPASMLSLFGDCESEYQYPILSPNWHFPSYSPKLAVLEDRIMNLEGLGAGAGKLWE